MEKNILQEMCQKNGHKLPKYKLESQGGTPNKPSFEVSVTVEWNGEMLVERATGEGKKKDVEKMAAKRMIDRLNGTSTESFTCGAVLATSPSTSNSAVQRSPRLSPVPNTCSRPVSSPPPNAKNELQELLQKSIFNYLPPKYDHLQAKGPSHKRQFTCRCVVMDDDDRVIHQTHGEGTTKKEAEVNSAMEMLPYIKAMLEDGGMLIPQGPSRTYQTTPPKEVLDPDLDRSLSTSLSSYTPQFVFREGIDNKWLCLAIAQSGCHAGQPAVASQGMGDSESAAKREAALNLIHNLTELGYVISS